MVKTFPAGRIQAGIPVMGLSPPPAQEQEFIHVTGLTKSQAEELLDCLEANRYREYHLSYTAGKGFSVIYANSR